LRSAGFAENKKKLTQKQDYQDKNNFAVNVSLPFAMPTTMFGKRLTSLILALLLSFFSFKEGRFESVGEFYFPC